MPRGGKQFNIFHFITTLCNKTQKKWMTEKRKKRLKSQFFVDYRVPDDDGEGNRSQIEISVLDALFSRHQYTEKPINFLNPGATRQKRLKSQTSSDLYVFGCFAFIKMQFFASFPFALVPCFQWVINFFIHGVFFATNLHCWSLLTWFESRGCQCSI